MVALVLLTACGGGEDATVVSVNQPAPAAPTTPPAVPPVAQAMKLPIEVLGPAGYIEAVEFELGNPSQVKRLSLQCHRCGWRDGTVQSGKYRGAKASVRINGGKWTDITDANVTLQAPELAFGGLSGGFHTTRLTLPIAGAVKGKNKLEFRFNKTDGLTSGYRILALNLLDANNKPVLGASSFANDDPTQWKVVGSAADIAEGKALWNGKVALKESPLSNKTLKANCASCHAADGRDLKYFNYSSWSIQARSQFHGLTDKQGQQIAAYVRSLNVPAPAQARPWNPPYQPGAGLDAKPVAEWSAGAGLAAVLDDDKDMIKHLFPKGTSQAEIDKVIDIKKTINVREMPVALQLPDWNDWLPHEHPLDIWADFDQSDFKKTYESVRTELVSKRANVIAEKRTGALMESLIQGRYNFAGFGGGSTPCQHYGNGTTKDEKTTNFDNLLPTADAGKPTRIAVCQRGMIGITPWLAVKLWELNHEFDLEAQTVSLLPYGEVRGWPGQKRHVFEMAAHRSGANSKNMDFQTEALGAYHSAAWYHMQMILNSGMRNANRFTPQDWFYTPQYITRTSVLNNRPLAGLAVLSQIKMYQNLDTTGPDGKGTHRVDEEWWINFVKPNRFDSETAGSVKPGSDAGKLHNLGYPWNHLATYQPGLQARISNALLREYLRKQKTFPVASLPRAKGLGDSGNGNFGSVGYVPKRYEDSDDACFYSCPAESHVADDYYRVIPRFIATGVDPKLVNELIDWSKEVWPKGDWDKLRP